MAPADRFEVEPEFVVRGVARNPGDAFDARQAVLPSGGLMMSEESKASTTDLWADTKRANRMGARLDETRMATDAPSATSRDVNRARVARKRELRMSGAEVRTALGAVYEISIT